MSKRFYCVLLAFVMLLAISCVAASEDSAIDDAKLAKMLEKAVFLPQNMKLWKTTTRIIWCLASIPCWS